MKRMMVSLLVPSSSNLSPVEGAPAADCRLIAEQMNKVERARWSCK
jgi:hypothetical protein